MLRDYYQICLIHTELIHLGSRLNLDIEEVTLGIETAIPCGLIINELVSNSLKHGFTGNETGEINVEIHKIDG